MERRVAREAELRVDLGELRDDVPEAVFHVGDELVDDLADLLAGWEEVLAAHTANRDRLRRELAH